MLQLTTLPAVSQQDESADCSSQIMFISNDQSVCGQYAKKMHQQKVLHWLRVQHLIPPFHLIAFLD